MTDTFVHFMVLKECAQKKHRRIHLMTTLKEGLYAAMMSFVEIIVFTLPPCLFLCLIVSAVY